MISVHHRYILRLFLLIFLAVCTAAVAPQRSTYKITRLSTPTITIGGKTLKKGDTFRASDRIDWADNKQTLEAKETATGKIYRLSKQVFESKSMVKTLADYCLAVSRGSTRGGAGANFAFRRGRPLSGSDQRRLALVIGNSNYMELGQLANAQRDAADMSTTLQDLGFDVIESYETTYNDMRAALQQFRNKADAYDVALFYYAGHGIQEEGKNYLVPIENGLELRSDIDKTLNADDVLYEMENSGASTRLLFLDACRDHRSSFSRSAQKGLARMEGSKGSVIVFSTQSGETASDGDSGKNSPFASAMIQNIRVAGQPFPVTLSNIVNDTYRMTNGVQCPLQVGNVIGDFIFNPAKAEKKQPSPTPTPSPTPKPQPEKAPITAPKLPAAQTEREIPQETTIGSFMASDGEPSITYTGFAPNTELEVEACQRIHNQIIISFTLNIEEYKRFNLNHKILITPENGDSFETEVTIIEHNPVLTALNLGNKMIFSIRIKGLRNARNIHEIFMTGKNKEGADISILVNNLPIGYTNNKNLEHYRPQEKLIDRYK